MTVDTIGHFAKMMPGRVLSSFGEGPALLRFTPHSVIAANCHRHQRGRVAEIKMAMATPDEARARLEAWSPGDQWLKGEGNRARILLRASGFGVAWTAFGLSRTPRSDPDFSARLTTTTLYDGSFQWLEAPA